MLNDKEKFTLAKNHNYIDLLLEIIQSNDSLSRASFLFNPKKSSCNDDLKRSFLQRSFIYPANNDTTKNGSFLFQTQPADVKSSLKKDWMQSESLISHSAIN